MATFLVLMGLYLGFKVGGYTSTQKLKISQSKIYFCKLASNLFDRGHWDLQRGSEAYKTHSGSFLAQ